MINKGLVCGKVCGRGGSVAGSKSRPNPPQVVPGPPNSVSFRCSDTVPVVKLYRSF